MTNCLSAFDHFMGLALKGLRFSDLIIDNDVTKCSSGLIEIQVPIFRHDLRVRSHDKQNELTPV